MKVVRYISHGDLEDGGYRHELFFAQSLAIKLGLDLEEYRERKLFLGWANVKLFFWGLFKSNSKHNVVAARLGIGSWLRNLFNRNRTYVVVHDYDKNRYNSFFLKLYYPLLFSVLRVIKPQRMKMVVISDYWVQYFKEMKGVDTNNLILFPNLLDVKAVLDNITHKEGEMIHLGQYSKKNSEKVFEVASILTKKGFFCYFSTLDKAIAVEKEDYSVLFFPSYESYLLKMAQSQFTLGFSRFHEGWNRVVHESALLNTPVIAFKMGGMQYLVKESSNYLVDTMEEALEIIYKGVEYTCPQDFIYKYDISKAQDYLNE